MRLVNTKTRKLEEHYGQSIPPYAILSHRWEEGEVLFHDLESGDYKRNAGFSKLEGAIRQAVSDGYNYLWVDTCCIDKSSSAELSEAINSMFAWYERSQVCYAYLSDVPSGIPPGEHFIRMSFRQSLWFTRGWTLQELIAPRRVVFFDRDWVTIGTKTDSRIAQALIDITGIQHLSNWRSASVAQRMSWLSKRKTTRIEDIAYCMLGIFGVHMPPLYGEEENAFYRLQLEILKISSDESLFAWKTSSEDAALRFKRGLLASSPIEFSNAGSVERVFDYNIRPFAMTNKGLQIGIMKRLLTTSSSNVDLPATYMAFLNCRDREGTIALYLEKSGYRGAWSRTFCDSFCPKMNRMPFTQRMRMRRTEMTEEQIWDRLRELNSSEIVYIEETSTSATLPQGKELQAEHVLTTRYLYIKFDGQAIQNYLYSMPDKQHGARWAEVAPYNFRIYLEEGMAQPMVFRFFEDKEKSALLFMIAFLDDQIMTRFARTTFGRVSASRNVASLFKEAMGTETDVVKADEVVWGEWQAGGQRIKLEERDEVLEWKLLYGIFYSLGLVIEDGEHEQKLPTKISGSGLGLGSPQLD